MRSVDNREVLRRYYEVIGSKSWDGLGELLAEDVVYDIPQTRERITGREPYVRFNREYPGDWRMELTRLVVDGDRAAGTMNFFVDGTAMLGITFFELADGVISRITDIWPVSYDPPPGREHLAERLPDLSTFTDKPEPA